MKNARKRTAAVLLGLLLVACGTVHAAVREVRVADDAGLRQTLADARPGLRILLAPGKYKPGVYVSAPRATAAEPIVSEAADPKAQPISEAGVVAQHESASGHLTARHLVISGKTNQR